MRLQLQGAPAEDVARDQATMGQEHQRFETLADQKLGQRDVLGGPRCHGATG